MRANDSSSSATSPSSESATPTGDEPGCGERCFEVDLLAPEGDDSRGPSLPPLPDAYLRGRDLDLLEPLRHLTPGPDALAELLAEPPPEVDRAALARALRTTNDAYGHPRAAELAEKLADPKTRVVVTGQQPGLWGGPLMTLSKAAAAVRWAEAIDDAGESAVAVFWVATEDHDFAETARATFLSYDGAVELDLGDDPQPLLPVGMRTFGPRLREIAEQAEEMVGGEDAVERFRRAMEIYRPDARFGEAFSRLMVRILGQRAPLFLDAMLPELKEAQAPHMRRLVEERRTLDEAYAERDASIGERGHPLQVHPQPGLSPLFLLHCPRSDSLACPPEEIHDEDGVPVDEPAARAAKSEGRVERRRIDWLHDDSGRAAGDDEEDDDFGLRGLDGFRAPVGDLLETIDDNPAAVTPGVLARPALQDAALGTTLQILGPGEVSYMAQAAPAYPILGIRAPFLTLRPQSLMLDERAAGWLEELDLPLAELLSRSPEGIVAQRLGSDPVSPVRERIDELLEELKEEVLAVDPTLEKPWKKTRDNVHRGLDIFGGKVRNAVANRHQVWLRRLEKLHDTLLPDDALQERKLSTLFFWARYGDALPQALFDGLDLDPRRLSVIRLG